MYIRTKEKILDMKNTNECIYVIRDTSKETENCYVSYLWDNWKNYYLIDFQSCMLFSYDSAQSFISDIMKENLNYQNLVIELSPYYKDCSQSENLEELCDRFIFHYQRIIDNKVVDNFHREFCFLWQAKERFDNCQIESKEIKGAIYTDKGLIYVAKMNDNGDLELI